MSSTNICPNNTGTFTDAELEAVFANGIATSTIEPDSITKKLPDSQLLSHISTLQTSGAIPNYPMTTTPGGNIDINAQTNADKAFLTKVQNEYCFYQQRYTFALNKFLTKAVSTVTTENDEATNIYLPKSEKLNRKLNSIMQILDKLNSTRVNNLTYTLQPQIDTLNNDIKTTSQQIQTQYALLSSNDAVFETQNQMIVYTKEKNEHVINQIALFTIMNAFAIGGIFAIWRMSK